MVGVNQMKDFHFEKCYSGLSLKPKEFYNAFLKTYFSSSQFRQTKSHHLINMKSQHFNVIDMFNVLRHHQSSKRNPINGLTNIDICMHASFGPIKCNQTTGSLVSVIPKSKMKIPTHYITCTSSTCLSIFKPIWLSSSLKPPRFLLVDQINSSLTYSTNNIWWKSEIINRNIHKYYQKLIQQIQIEREVLEKEFVSKANQLSLTNISHEQRNHLTYTAFDQVKEWVFVLCRNEFY